MTPSHVYAVAGFLFLMTGIAFDFGYLAPTISKAFQGNASTYLNSFTRYIHELARTYLLVLGLAHLAASVLTTRFDAAGRLDWLGCALMIVGTILIVSTAFWYAQAGPSFKWELRCTVLSIGLVSLLGGLGILGYLVFSSKT